MLTVIIKKQTFQKAQNLFTLTTVYHCPRALAKLYAILPFQFLIFNSGIPVSIISFLIFQNKNTCFILEPHYFKIILKYVYIFPVFLITITKLCFVCIIIIMQGDNTSQQSIPGTPINVPYLPTSHTEANGILRLMISQIRLWRFSLGVFRHVFIQINTSCSDGISTDR